MKGDFSRFTHDARDHFNRVYKQQGRAELDADFNESVDLATELSRTEAIDVIGQAGVPKGDSFKVEVLPGNSDLKIHHGRMYVDGILCELDADVHYTNQPGDVPQAAIVPALNRKDLVFLHVMERHVTWVEDDGLLEPALEGADTCTRVQTIAQIRMQTGIAGNSTCGAVPNWPPAASAGLLSTGTKAVGPAPNPCVIPESAGFRGTENRLYRVEVHTGGSIGTATFKWSRDNGAVLVPVAFIGQAKRVQATTLGRDQVLGLKKGDWVELATDTTDLTPLSGTLTQIVDITPDLIVELKDDVSVHDGQTHPKLRRWDQASDALLMDGGAVLDLEDGITVQFSGGPFQAGDAWMFTARIGADVEQLTNARPSSLLHHYAPLAIITWVADPNNAAALVGEVESCRPQFPPLTDITADDVTFDGGACAFGADVTTVQQAIDALCGKQEECCTVVVRPGPDWQQVFDTIPAAGAHLCFRPGVYQLTTRVEISKKTTIVMSGVGDAAKITALNDECCLRFVDCASVTIRDLSAEGKVAQLLSGRQQDGILGVIAIKNAAFTGDVLVENCRLHSADGPYRTTACLSIHGGSRAVVRNNRLEAGIQQVGVLFVNVLNVEAEGNLLTGTVRLVSSLLSFLGESQFLAGVRTRLVTHLVVGGKAPLPALFNVTATVGGQTVWFLGPATHVNQWKALLVGNPMPGFPSATSIADHVTGLANRILKENAFPSFTGIRAQILGNVAPAAQGITVGGTSAESVRILNNRLTGFMQGVHVGLSAPSPSSSTAERIVIHENQIGITLGAGSTRGRHGIFVGNVNSLSVRGNRFTLTRPTGPLDMQVDGVRVFGRLGRMVIIRENHLTGFNVGVRFEVRAAPSTPMWMIDDNLAEGSSQALSTLAAVRSKNNNFG